MKDLKEKNLKVNQNAEALEADMELSIEELDGVSGGIPDGMSAEEFDELFSEVFSVFLKKLLS